MAQSFRIRTVDRITGECGSQEKRCAATCIKDVAIKDMAMTWLTKTLPKLGMTLGIVIIGGSMLGGAAMATGFGGASTPDPGLSVPARDDSGSASTSSEVTTGAPATGHPTDASSGPANEPGPVPLPSAPDPLPTCWDEDAPGERPDGIEDCEDEPSHR